MHPFYLCLSTSSDSRERIQILFSKSGTTHSLLSEYNAAFLHRDPRFIGQHPSLLTQGMGAPEFWL